MSSWKSKSLVLVLIVLTGTATLGVMYKQEVIAHFHAWRMKSAPTDALDRYVVRFEELAEPGIKTLVGILRQQDQTYCTKSTQVLHKLYQLLPAQSLRRQYLFSCLAEQSTEFSPAGQQACLVLLKDLCESPDALDGAGKVLQGMMQVSINGSEQKLAILELMALILGNETPAGSEIVRHAKNLVNSGLRDNEATVRLAAIRLAVNPALQLHEQLIPLISKGTLDPSGEVRQLALLAVGEYQKLISTDDVCLLLMDNEEEVRLTAERVLKLRGLSPSHIKMARLVNDPLPASRAEVPALVLGSSDLDSYLWMERLTKDPSPAVRAATAKVMAQAGDDRLTSLLKKLIEEDRDPTVRKVAQFYWKP